MPDAEPIEARLISRRSALFAAVGATGAALTAGCASSRFLAGAAVGSNPFTLGVASGYPTPDGMVLWTRLLPAPEADDAPLPPAVSVRWELSDNEAFRGLVTSGTVTAAETGSHSVHVEITDLPPNRWYWYRFIALGHRSRTGRTRTLPPLQASLASLRLIVASCQNIEHGYFAAYRHLVADEPDLIVHVGDYIYEGSWGTVLRPLRLPEATTLAQYRERHAIYKRDPDLQAAHAHCPWVMVWDDHEVSNDYAAASPERITAPDDFLQRRGAAYQAYYEHMPMPRHMAPVGPAMTIHTSVRIGTLATLYLLDDRQYRTPQACPRPGRSGGNTVVPAQCAPLQDPARTALGAAQETWLDQAFAKSTTQWNLIAQQTLMAPLALPGQHGSPPRVRTDGWDGYPGARRRLLDSIHGLALRNPVVLGGDVHAFYAADLHQAADPATPIIASEFVTTSITSQAADQGFYSRVKAANGHLRYADGSRRGYLRLSLERGRLQADMMGLDDVSRADSGIVDQAAFVVEAGRPGPQAV